MALFSRKDELYYEEKQSLPKWIFIIILFPALLFWGIAFVQLGTGEAVGNRPMSDTEVVVIALLFGTLLPLLFAVMKGRVKVSPAAVTISLVPFYVKTVQWHDIEQLALSTVSPIKQFGGWGIRWNGAKWGLILQGEQGVELVLKSGQTLVISSRTAEQLLAAIDEGVRRYRK